jgi:hypothetical protein
MDPEQVVRTDDGAMRCRQCGFTYELPPEDLLEQVAVGMAEVRSAVASVPEKRRDARPSPEVWSVNAYVAHLADAAAVITERVRRIATEDNPSLAYHQQDDAADEGRYDEQPADRLLERLGGTVEEFVDYTRSLPPSAWSRTGVHALAGPVTLSEIAHDMAHELRHHAEDIRVQA